MRDIKFRFWDNEEGKYNNFYPLSIKEDGTIYWCTPTYGKWEKAPINRFLPEQYTGLKDKNEKEIFEGDIIKLGEDTYDLRYDPYENVIVEWDNETTGFKPFQDTHSDYNYINEKTCEIIGNIHENKEVT